MNLLLIGGSGVISRAVAEEAVAAGHAVWVLNRGRRRPVAGTNSLIADTSDPASLERALRGRVWDAAVDFIAFTADEVRRDVALLGGRVGQYVLISSASVYRKPLPHYRITEATALGNPYWEYARQKIACERALQEACAQGFPGVTVRPSLTYGEDQVPLVLNAWSRSWTLVDRMRRGAPVVIPGDGSSLWTLTHNTDFARGLVGLLGNPAARGEAFHITSDEVLTWNDIFRVTAEAAGAQGARFVHIPSDFIISCVPAVEGTLLGDKAVSAVFDNAKIRRFVPGFSAAIPFAEGIRRTIAWFDAHPEFKQVDPPTNERWDRLTSVYEAACTRARAEFPGA